jgi:hypothetical protein
MNIIKYNTPEGQYKIKKNFDVYLNGTYIKGDNLNIDASIIYITDDVNSKIRNKIRLKDIQIDALQAQIDALRQLDTIYEFADIEYFRVKL